MKLSHYPVLDLTQTSPALRSVLESAPVGDYGLYGVESLMRAILNHDTTETARALALLGVTRETFDAALKAVRDEVRA